MKPGVLLETIRRLASADSSHRVRDEAQRFLDQMGEMRKIAARWHALPPEQRERTMRHAGKWVALVDGKVISADRHTGQIRRDIKGHGRPDAQVVFVPPVKGEGGAP